MTRSRAFHRFHRWTAKVRRRHLRANVPEPREGDLALLTPGTELRRHAWERDQLADLVELNPKEDLLSLP